MTRRATPQTAQKLGKNPRDREREWEEERWFDEERESFPQFCMTCEKQFVPQDERFLYCSEACRIRDQENASASTLSAFHSGGAGYASVVNYPLYSGVSEPKDIIPRASPSRPSSTHFSPPATPTTTTAVTALRSISTYRPPSPPSPSIAYHASLWPFTRSAATSPNVSYARPPAGTFSSTYDGAYYSPPAAEAHYGARPLPSRSAGSYARPKSIELVTPMVGR
ncbi:hypothetical protein P8C59_004859 [Phyllachora maydis]|uniref:Life-span regulatory factor n=1 Tax=Phyllachora maydis TaxID=1825666 RepID=A0AAD9I377_9PEZI|nr:hypothetical protein P8C59_004859 [Phyllachora maydis]